MNVRDCEHNYLILDTNGNDSNVSPLKHAFLCRFLEDILQVIKFPSNAYIRKEKRCKINHLSFHLKKLEKEEQIKLHVSRRKDIKQDKAEIGEIEKNNRKKNQSQRLALQKHK